MCFFPPSHTEQASSLPKGGPGEHEVRTREKGGVTAALVLGKDATNSQAMHGHFLFFFLSFFLILS